MPAHIHEEEPLVAADTAPLKPRVASTPLPDPSQALDGRTPPDVWQMVLDWAQRTPEAAALRCAGRTWTFAALAAQAGALATQMAAAGIGHGDVVAIEGPRSPGVVMAMLATLHRGAVFMPIDTALPRERRVRMLQQTEARLHVRIGPATMGDDLGAPVLELDLEADGPLVAAASAPTVVTVSGDDPAYVFFTSGSTGQPKGVLGRRKGLSHFLRWQGAEFGIAAGDRVSQMVSIGFDPMLRDIFLPLTHGATLCIPQESDLLDPLAWFAQEGITAAHSTPTVLGSWLQLAAPETTLPALRWLFVAGEPLSDVRVAQWRRRFGTAAGIVNLYGPTETTMAKCWYVVPDTPLAGIQPVGRTLPDSQALVLRPDGRPCEVGELGEIVIRTPFRSLGYIGLPEETQARFQRNPARDDADDLLYRTGDLGRYLSDGQLAIAGRLDDQVKIRGVRIEPAEVAACLAGVDGVRHCAVLARCPAGGGEPMLVAYVELTADQALSTPALRDALSERLPAAMVPSTFVVMAQLPRLPNGKIDRKALPAPSDAQAAPTAERVAPTTDLERTCWALWKEALGHDHFGVRDDFFGLGGHSLLAIQVLSRLKSHAGVLLPLRTLFEAPTIEQLAQRVEAAGVLAASFGNADDPPITPRHKDQPAPLSFSQQALWFLDRLNGPSAAYNLNRAVRLRGELDVATLERSLAGLIERHDSLRTAVEESGDDARLVVVPAASIAPVLRVETFATDPGADPGALMDRLAGLVSEPFDLARAPLLRAHLLRLGANEHVLLLVVHHIVSDGWSMGLIARELGELYRQAGQAETLPALPVQFPDYALWKRERFAGGARADQVAYWRGQLHGLEPLVLPSDRPRPVQLSPRGGVVNFELAAAQVSQLKALAQRRRATLFMVTLAALKVLLMRHAGQHDIAVGAPVAGRRQSELQGVVGYFVNMLVLRTDLSGSPSFEALIDRVRHTAIDAFSNQDLPFDRMVAELRPERDLSRNPFYQVGFALQNAPDDGLHLPGLVGEALELRTDTTLFDLSLSLTERGGSLQAELTYSCDLFDRPTIERMAGHFQVLVDGLLANPTQAITRAPLLSGAERQTLLHDWNHTAQPYTLDHSLQALFEAQVARAPQALALAMDDRQIDYQQLNACANVLAHRLRTLGVGPDVLVGVCMERSFELIIGLLAVLKAGGAFLPMDPEYPTQRLGFMLEDSQAPVILTQAHLRGLLDGLASRAPFTALVVQEDDLRAAAANAAEASDPVDLTGMADLAYAIFTSGSTGRPKGALNTHRGLCNHVLWLKDAMRMTPADRVAHKTTISFDAAIWEIFTPLVCGASVILARPGVHRDMQALTEFVIDGSVSVLQMVPSALRAWLTEARLDECRRLRYVVSGGEALELSLAQAFQRVLPHTVLGNFYGPSEASDDATWFELSAMLPDRAIVPIGRPIGNVQCHILDEERQLVPQGVVGELCVGGVSVGRGYLGRPELTAEKFIDDPFHAGQRLYRTGDLARWLSDGCIEYVGRIDHQVKIRGQRVELGEIESVLNACDGVRQSAVLLREVRAGLKQLVAYVVAPDTVVAGLKTGARARLPDHMVPALFVRMDQLPVLPNGKLDRKALPAPDAAAVPTQASAPRDEVEQAIWHTWRELLAIETFGVEDNFFELGGHSLIASQLVSRLRKRWGIALALRTLFERPTIATLAEHVKTLLTSGAQDSAAPTPAIARRRPDAPTPLSFQQEALWYLDQLEGPSSTYNVWRALRMQGTLRIDALERALRALVERHESLRTAFVAHDGVATQVVRTTAQITDGLRLVPEHLSTAAPDERAQALEPRLRELAETPFDLREAPLLRLHLLHVGTQDHVLLLVAHHIISDGWSIAILLEELSALYRANAAGTGAALPALPLQAADVAVWQHEQFRTGAQAKQLEHWRARLAGLEALELPSDRSRPARPSHRGGTVRFQLDASLVGALDAIARRENATLFMVLLAAYQVMLMRHSQQRDLAVGVPVAGRDAPELQRLIGYFVNMVVLRNDLGGAPTFTELLARVRQTSLEAFSHAELPFDKLVAELRPQRDPSRNPLFQVAMVLQNGPGAGTGLQLEGLRCESLELGGSSAKFDLTLWLDPHEGGLSAALEYAVDLYDADRIERMAGHLSRLLANIAAEPATPITTLGMLGDLERTRLLVDWNRNDHAYAADACMHTGFETQVRQRPQAVALSVGDQTLSYAELGAHSRQFAAVLRARGIGRGALVGLNLERGVSMLVAQLGILQAGAAYVPLDPAYPIDRLSYMCKDAGLALLVSASSQVLAGTQPRERTLLLDADAAEIAAASDAALHPDAQRDARPEDPAYVIYTSGSTGKPKGVVVPHRGVVNFLDSMAREPGLGADDRLLAITTLSFDIAVLELLLPLSTGARVVLASREQATDGHALRQLIEREGVTVMQATPSSWRLLIESGWSGTPGLKALIGGEGLPIDLAQQLIARCDSLWNMYGPTETTVWSTCARIEQPELGITIGRPIANTQVHVLDEHGQLCPIGVPGELHIGGNGVTLGYLNRAELTAERFIPDPFRSGARLYRTGDRARWRADGCLEHLGRLDFQVKVRGHRIELGEIEANLATHPSVARALVITREDRPGDVRIVAYLVPRGALAPVSELRSHLRAHLPEYMLPQHVVVLAEIPLLPNGKIDRHALPPPTDTPSASTGADKGGPDTPAEQAIAAVWARLLGVDTLRVSDNFFDLGGHSLLAMQAVGEIERSTGLRLSVGRLVVESLAQLAASLEAAPTPRAPVAAPAPTGGMFQRLWSRIARGNRP